MKGFSVTEGSKCYLEFSFASEEYKNATYEVKDE